MAPTCGQTVFTLETHNVATKSAYARCTLGTVSVNDVTMVEFIV